MISASKYWRVISRNGNLQSKEEENDNGMAAGDQIQYDFCTFSKSRANPDQGATPTLCKEYRYWLQTRRTIPVGSGKSK